MTDEIRSLHTTLCDIGETLKNIEMQLDKVIELLRKQSEGKK